MAILPDRQQRILRATVHHYVDTMEPVGSQTLVRRFSLKASSSTVRSDMGALEEMGFLMQPHASAGRVPSPQGYRHYVDCLLPPPGVAAQHLQKELTTLSLKWAALDDLLWQLAKRLTDFTGLMSLITKPTNPAQKESKIQEVRLVQSGDRLLIMLVQDSNSATHLNVRLPQEASNEIEGIEKWFRDQLIHTENGFLDWNSLPSQFHMSGSILKEAIHSHSQSLANGETGSVFHGMSRLVSQPEFRNSNTVRPLLDLLDSQPEAVVPINKNDVPCVWIGEEHPHRALVDCSVVKASYRSSNHGLGHVALIGPMRMTYSTAIAAVNKVAGHLEKVLS